jgi:hypothetical protein
MLTPAAHPLCTSLCVDAVRPYNLTRSACVLCCDLFAVIPPGFYMKAPGVIAPCPMGEWKDGTGPAGNCTKCVFGVTTASEASASAASCAVLLPGYYAAAIAATGEIRSAGICPQNYWCGGGSAAAVFDPLNPVSESIRACPFGTWTQERGAVSSEQCCKYRCAVGQSVLLHPLLLACASIQ